MKAHAKRGIHMQGEKRFHVIYLWTTPVENGDFYHAYLFTRTRATIEEMVEERAKFADSVGEYHYG